MSSESLIAIRQFPIIEDRLREVKEAWERAAEENMSLVCTEDTIQSVKGARTDMTKQFNELEALRKTIKKQYMAAYETFDVVYKNCITEPYKRADAALKGKIAEVEDVQKAECEAKCRAYFAELCAVHSVGWLQYEQASLKISLTEAKKKTPNGHFDKLSEFVARVACDMDAIGNDAETAAEYKANGLNLARAQKTVRERREAQEAERRAAEERAERKRLEAEAVAKVEAAAPVVVQPPVVVETPKPVDENILTVAFKATGTRAQLIKLREFMKSEGIRYE